MENRSAFVTIHVVASGWLGSPKSHNLMRISHEMLCIISAFSIVRGCAVNYEEFKRRLGKAGLSVKEFADLMRIGCNSVSNYAAKGVVPVHLAVAATLMGEMADHQLDFRLAINELNLKEKKPRGASARGGFGGNRQLSIL